jgi:hypothetical protein
MRRVFDAGAGDESCGMSERSRERAGEWRLLSAGCGFIVMVAMEYVVGGREVGSS